MLKLEEAQAHSRTQDVLIARLETESGRQLREWTKEQKKGESKDRLIEEFEHLIQQLTD